MTAKEKLKLIQNEIEREKRGVFLNSDWNKCKEFVLNQLQGFIAQLDTIDDNKERLSEHKMDKCTTCTNDKGCVTCENGEQWEGEGVDNSESDNPQKKFECDLEDDYSDFMGLNRGAICHQHKGDCKHRSYSSIKETEEKAVERTDDELEEAVSKYAIEDRADFIAGANWQKEQMMKGFCFETKVYRDDDGDGIESPFQTWLELENNEITSLPNLGLKEGDKVKVIIIKEK